jgi:hypothetical protein
MNQLDVAILFGINGDEPELGLALFTVAHCDDVAVSRQYSNSPVDTNLFICGSVRVGG